MGNNIYDENLNFVITGLKKLFILNNVFFIGLLFILRFFVSCSIQITLNILEIYNGKITVNWNNMVIYKEIVILFVFVILFALTIKYFCLVVKQNYNIIADLQDIENNIKMLNNVTLIPSKNSFTYLVVSKDTKLKKPKRICTLLKLDNIFLNKNSNVVYLKNTRTIVYLESNQMIV